MIDQSEPDLDALIWTDLLSAEMEGRGFAREQLARPCDRLPAEAEGKVPSKVWDLSRQPAGLSVRFRTDATEIFARWAPLWEPWLAEAETRLRQTGLDFYAQNEDGRWYFAGWGLPWRDAPWQSRLNKAPLDPGMRTYRLYLPHSMPLTALSVGVEPGCQFELLGPDRRKPIVIYGTSICHGAMVSRPGMAHTSILSRKIDWPVVNLGFAGNGRMDEPVVALLGQIDAAVYIIDCLPNMSAEQIRDRTEPLVSRLRRDRPETPILFVGNRLFGDARFLQARRERFDDTNGALEHAFEQAKTRGWENIHLLSGRNFFGEDFEGSVDGSHPSDLGAMRMAEALLPTVSALLDDARER